MIQVPAYDVQDQLRSGALVELLPDWRAEPLHVTLLYPHRRHAARRVRIFADWMADLMAPLLLA